MPKDYYVVLGITKGANLNQIKKAYRKTAKQFHPDSTQSTSSKKFREIKEAYETLADEGRRRIYDAELERQRSPLRVSRVPEIIAERRSIYDEMDRFGSFVDEFFEGAEILIKDDKRLRENRVGLLQHLAKLFLSVADLSKFSI